MGPGMLVALLFAWTMAVVTVTYWLVRRSTPRVRYVLASCEYCQRDVPQCKVRQPGMEEQILREADGTGL